MMKSLPPVAEDYVRTTNAHDAAAFWGLFADDAVVNDNGREFRGIAAIKEWSEREIFAANVSLKVIDSAERDGHVVITTEVDGNFDRTGLPNPVVINQHVKQDAGKIIALTCRLVN